MKGYISIEIPTKPYIKAYVLHKLGPHPVMSTEGDTIGNKLFDLLQHRNDERGARYHNSMYTTSMIVYIPINTFKRRGDNLNATNLKAFNLYIEAEVKHWFHFLMEHALEILPNINSNLPAIRKRLGIDIEAWSDDSMRKSFYRFRLDKEKNDLKKKKLCKTFAPSVLQNYSGAFAV